MARSTARTEASGYLTVRLPWWRKVSPGFTLAMTAAVLGAVIMMVPFAWGALTSFKPSAEYLRIPPTWLPEQWTLDGYELALYRGNILTGLKNSFIVAGISTVLMVLSAVLAGYAFARLRFPFNRVIFMIVLATMMIPWPVTLLPLFIMMVKFPLAGGNDIFGSGGRGLVDTYEGLILPSLGFAYGTYLMREFFKALPAELEDAARVDGAGELRILFQIMVPLSKPAMAALSIIAFQNNWNSFIWPLVMTNKPSMAVVQIVLQQLQLISSPTDRLFIRWDAVNAGGLLSLIPLAIFFLFFQRYFIRGIAMTGFK